MPGLLLSTKMDPVAEMPGKEPEYGYIVSHQEVKLEVDFATQSLKGWTQLTILPLTRDLKEIRIDARQCSIGDGDVQVNRKNAMFEYDDPMELMDVPDSWDWSVHQHKLMQERIEPLVKPTRADGALIITIPRAVRVEEVNPMSVNAASEVTMRAADASAARGASVAFDGTGTSLPAGVPFTAKTAAEQAGRFNPLKVGISFTTKRFRDGLHFVGLGEGDMRYPHVYSKHSMDAGTASCIFPCVDDPAMRCTWEISIKCSRTLGDALRRQPVVRDHRNLQHLLHKKGLTNGVPPPLPEEYEVPLSDEDKLLEMAIICSGSLITETIDSEDGSKKVASFVVNQDMAPQHIGLAIGPFEQIDLSEFREEKDDEKLGQGQTLPVSGYCLPGRGDEVRHTCAPLAHALDYFLLQYGTFPSDECRFVFVDDQVHDVEHTASLSICSTRLLYGEDIIDPEIENLRILVHAIASQWMGVAVVAEKPGDRWVTVGLSHWMTDLFMKTICGHNDYLFRQKMLTDKLVKLDVTRPALTELGKYLHVGEFEHDFMKLKAPLVMFILDKRCVKASGSVGLSRVLSRIIVIANTGGPSDSVVSSDSFKKLAEKVTRYRQMDAFWAQWVNGAGCPKLNISQKFNKKRLCVEVTITQKHEPINSLDVPKLKPLEKFSFQREFKEEVEVVYAGDLQAYFTGPMTIRIHEADGTPYEHIVDIKEGNCKIEIPYNTKYKRLKRRNLQKARQAAGGAAQNGDANDEALYYCLGDVLQTDDEMRDWGLSKWEEATEKMMEGEFYEWIRVDADFEWLCEKTFVNMPAYMYVSQLQQDRDVVAQQEAIVYLKGAPPHPLPSTFLLRTVMDYRYFHGIRELAAEALVTHAVPVTSYTGLRHLEKAYQTLFCYVDTKMPKSNDFSDKRVYKLEMAMVRSFANMRDPDGRCPQDARVWLLDILRFNDNTNNEIVDYFKIANLLSALTDSIIQKVDKTNLLQDGVDEAKEWEYDQFKGSVIDALDRYRRMDEWINSYQNIFTVTVLDCKQRLMKANVIPHDPKEFAQYLHDGTSDYVRIKAFEALVELGLMNVPSVATFLLDSMSSDPSPFMRDRLLQIFFVGLAIYAFGENKTKEKRSRPAIKAPVTNRNLLNGDVDVLMGGVSNGVMPLAESNGDGGLLIDEDVNLEGRKADIDRTTTIDGAIAALKLELKDNVELKDALWNAIKSQVIEPHEQVDLLEVCGQIYEAVDSMIVKLPKPRFWKVEYLGKGVMHFTKSNKFRKKSLRPVIAPPVPEKPLLKLNIDAPQRNILILQTLKTQTPKPPQLPATLPPKPQAIKLVNSQTPKVATVPPVKTFSAPPKPVLNAPPRPIAALKSGTPGTPSPKITFSANFSKPLKRPHSAIDNEQGGFSVAGTQTSKTPSTEERRPRKIIKLNVPGSKLQAISSRPPNPAPRPKPSMSASPAPRPSHPQNSSFSKPSPSPRPSPAPHRGSPGPSTISVMPRTSSTPGPSGGMLKIKMRKPLPDSGKMDKPKQHLQAPRQPLPGAPPKADKPRQPLPASTPKSDKPRHSLPGSSAPRPQGQPHASPMVKTPSDMGAPKAKPKMIIKLKIGPGTGAPQIKKEPSAGS